MGFIHSVGGIFLDHTCSADDINGAYIKYRRKRIILLDMLFPYYRNFMSKALSCSLPA
jgi:hypothetical protein